MASESDATETGVYHDGREVGVRSVSRFGQNYHKPTTDDDGAVVFDDNGDPEPECQNPGNDDTQWVLRPTEVLSNHGACERCFEPDRYAEQNAANAAAQSFARRVRSGESAYEGTNMTGSNG